VPVRRMLTLDVDAIEARARALAQQLVESGWRVALVSGSSAVGGGSAPGVQLPTVLLALERDELSAAALEARFRGLETPLVARILDDRVVLDLRTIPEDLDSQLAAALRW
jgi:L-seryl-tRNA(Ser) seleniumtransferase